MFVHLFCILDFNIDPPMLLQMATFHPVLWLSDIPCSMYIPRLLHPFIGWQALSSSSSVSHSVVSDSASPQTVACQAPLSMGFSRQEHWCGLPFLSPNRHLGCFYILAIVNNAALNIEVCISFQISVFVFFPCGSAGKESACNARDLGSIPGWEDPLEKRMATHSSVLAWRIPWTL